MIDKIFNEDCLEGTKRIADGTVDFVLTDLPYGTGATEFHWDKQINLEKFFCECCRVLKKTRCIVLFASEPFASRLRVMRQEIYKYDWIWAKNTVTNYQCAKLAPLKAFENILVFSQGNMSPNKTGNMLYNPQGLIEIPPRKKIKTKLHFGRKDFGTKLQEDYTQTQTNYPKNILYFSTPPYTERFHPTQKPVDLLEYLIKTYTNESELVLDATIGSGSTAVACVNTGRHFIGFETEEKFYEIANKRIAEAQAKKAQELL